MLRESVASSNIESIGYNVVNQELEVEFKSGGIYNYHGVPQDVWADLMAAESKGRFLAANIKGKFGTDKDNP